VNVLVGRADEVAVIDGFLADSLAEPRALLIDGEPGIGKTTLLHHLLTLASRRGYTVLSCRSTRSEMDLSYAGLVELLGELDNDVVAALPDPQARALRVMLRREDPDSAVDRLSLGIAVVAAVRTIASTRPVLLAVDDAQWLDHPSAKTIAFVVRRLAGTTTRMAVVRSDGGRPTAGKRGSAPSWGDGVDWHAELARAVPVGRLETLRLGPIDPSELGRILRRALGWVPAWPRVVRIAELSAGNPLYALELARAFGAARSSDDLDHALPDGVLELSRSRIANLPRRVRKAVELAAVPGTPTLDLLRRLDPAALDLREALEAAARRGILSVDGERILFSHPILAAAAYGSIPPDERRRLHRAVAMLADDLEERARHLAKATVGADPQVAVALEGAAEQAWRRGAPDAAADLLRLACRLTPPTDADALALRRVAFGRLLHSSGDAPGAIGELEAVVDSLPPGLIRARALFHLMYVTRLAGSPVRAVEFGAQAAAEAAEDPSFQSQVYELLSRISDDDIELKLETARKGVQALARVAAPDPTVVFHGRAALVEAEFYAGLGIHLDRLDGLDPGSRRQFPPLRTASRGEDLIGRLLTYGGHIDEGLQSLRGMYERASVEGRSVLPAVLGWMAEAEIMAGRFTAAAALTEEAIERAEEIGTEGGTPWEVGFHAVALAMLGRLDDAEQAASRITGLAEADPSVGLDEAPARLALGIVALARGRFADAVAHLQALDQAKRAAGIREPRLCAHTSELIEALVGSGALADAVDVLARFEEEAETSAGQWSRAAAARCRALVLATKGDLDAALTAAERALLLIDGLPMPFERARTVFALGQLRRRRREKSLARQALQEALAAFEELGTPVWAERARAELARIPLRQTTTGLTPTEERIARLAVEGLTNREIADRTFLSLKTVEVNLTRVYRKLGVRSRAVLATRLAEKGSGDQA
jgi:DNA-binding CsgD family transcriptional regulator/KaiC/GvpD/RAD55 family RecA-like ATPase